MFRWVTTFIALTCFIVLAQITAAAQTFELPEARAGENYRVQIEQVLRDNYRLRLQTSSTGGVIEWAHASGNLPPGLSVRPNGFIVGMPQSAGDQTFAFQLRVSDSAAKQDALSLEFLLKVKGGGLRLVKFEGPILTPTDGPSQQISEADGDQRVRAPNSQPSLDAPASPPEDGDVLKWAEPARKNGYAMGDFTQSEIDLGLAVKEGSPICMLYVTVAEADSGKSSTTQQKVDKNKKTQRIKVALGKGVNTITITPHAPKDTNADCTKEDVLAKLNPWPADKLGMIVNCNGPECGKAPAASAGNGNGEGGNGNEKSNISQNPFSSRNRRFIVGFEQSGAASAESKGQPFLDLFFTAPLPWRRKVCPDKDPSKDCKREELKLDAEEAKKHPFARFSLWGNVKLNSTPQQIAALADVTSNAVSAITEGKVNKLTLGFEFVAGPEIRLATAGRTHISFIGGFGAVTPLAPTQTTQIYKTPDPASSQAVRFFQKYPGAQGKPFIGFTTPERDRFLRQYFGGFRFRSYRYSDKGELLDQFPGIFDVTFGQNEAVTGGTFHKFVVGLDGFYSLPFGERRFLFLFGSARFKAGGPKTKEAPFILDTAESSVLPTDSRVFLADPTPSNRDNYRLGFGVDLIEIFKAATNKTEKPKGN